MAFQTSTAMLQLLTLFIFGLIIYAAVTLIKNSNQKTEKVEQIELLLKEIKSKLDK